MRNQFVKAVGQLAASDERVVVLTGDLGFMALEPLRDQLGPRFINAGIAEQNMISVAAGMAERGLIPWVYSIAPFAFLRPYEQLRNDVALHNLPVKIVGNGGGFGYGIMGATHHALEDLACFRLLPAFKIAAPVFSSDVGEAVEWANEHPGPVYLRLNLEVQGPSPSPFRSWRRLAEGEKAVVVTVGTVAQGLLELLNAFPKSTFDVFTAGILPIDEIPDDIFARIDSCGSLIVLEEHLSAGGLAEHLSTLLLQRLRRPIRFLPLAASGYPSGRYGSQKWHREENRLAGAPLKESLERFLEKSHGE